MSAPTTETVPPGLRRLGEKQSLGAYLREIWDRRDFMLEVPLSDLRAQNQNTMLGNLWHLLDPLLLSAVFYLVFGVLFQGRGDVENFTAFLVIGVMTFRYNQKLMLTGTRTIVNNIKLIQSLSFPRALLPISASIAEFLSQAPAIVTMVVIAAVTNWFEPDVAEVLPGAYVLLLAPSVVLQTMFGAGLAFVMARLTFHFRDTAQFIPYFTRLWLYMSGVFFTVDRIPPQFRDVFQLNPANAFIRMNRGALIDGRFEPDAWLIATVWSVVVFVWGFMFFRSREREYGNA